jgi:hypothetical protein
MWEQGLDKERKGTGPRVRKGTIGQGEQADWEKGLG